MADGTWKLRTDVMDPRNFAFGFGRRVCPGTHIADQSIFATLATVVHTLDIRRAKDRNGKEVIPEARMNSGLICHPVPFEYEIHKRPDADKLLEMCATSVE
jgi:cytochrome P450